MNFSPLLPADCQGNNKSFPWNQTNDGEPESFGSDCCSSPVQNIDGVLICSCCGEACEEVFESEEAFEERMADEENWAEAGRYEDRFEEERYS